jgi:hypothetical protein
MGKEAIIALLEAGDFVGEGCVSINICDFTGKVSRIGGYNAQPGELLYEQVPGTGLHSI